MFDNAEEPRAVPKKTRQVSRRTVRSGKYGPATHCGLQTVGRKVPGKLVLAHPDRGNKPLGDTATSHVCYQGVHGLLPSGLRHASGDPRTGNNSRIAFRE